jgi:hypothetical protein
VVPRAKEGFAGVSVIEVRTGWPTFSVVDALNEPVDAVIVVDPWMRLTANPALLTVATVGDEEIQFTDEVRFCVLPSAYVPVAVNC